MLDPEIPEERREEIASEARQRIESGGTLKHDTAWGMRKLAYEIRQRTEADYRFFRFETEGGLLDELNHNLRIADGVLRFRIFKVDPRSPTIVPPPPPAVAAAAPARGAAPLAGGRRRRQPDAAEAAPAPEGRAGARGASREAAAEEAPEAAPRPRRASRAAAPAEPARRSRRPAGAAGGGGIRAEPPSRAPSPRRPQ